MNYLKKLGIQAIKNKKALHDYEIAKMQRKELVKLKRTELGNVDVAIFDGWSDFMDGAKHKVKHTDDKCVIIEFKAKAGFRMPTHSHIGQYKMEAVWTRKGKFKHELEDSIIYCKPGFIQIINAEKDHAFEALEYCEGYVLFTKV
jgi:quercetin dioxygenase-like cupin family protein